MEERAVKAASGAIVDVLDGGDLTQLGTGQAAREAAVVASGVPAYRAMPSGGIGNRIETGRRLLAESGWNCAAWASRKNSSSPVFRWTPAPPAASRAFSTVVGTCSATIVFRAKVPLATFKPIAKSKAREAGGPGPNRSSAPAPGECHEWRLGLPCLSGPVSTPPDSP